MKTKRHWVLYFTSLPFDIVGWIAVLLIWGFWGENLRWEKKPGKGDAGKPFPDGFCLACDLMPDSWPARSWYRMKVDGEHKKLPVQWRETHGTWMTWGGTTISPHAIFYGPGQVDHTKDWTSLQEHEHIHSEQGEASMLLGFVFGLVVFVVTAALGKAVAGAILGGVIWFTGFIMYSAAGWFTAWLRGENFYRGSHHEEAAYAIDDNYGS